MGITGNGVAERNRRNPPSTLPSPVTYNMGTKTIDYILGTSNNTDILVLYKAQLHIAGKKKQ